MSLTTPPRFCDATKHQTEEVLATPPAVHWRPMQDSDFKGEFTRLPNLIHEYLARTRMTASEYRLYHAYAREILGWNSYSKSIGPRSLRRLTGMSRSHIAENRAKLLRRGLISVSGKEVTLMFPNEGTFQKFPNEGTGVPQSGNKSVPEQGTRKSVSSRIEGKKSEPKDIDKDILPKRGKTNHEPIAPAALSAAAIAEVIVCAQGTCFDSSAQQSSYVKKFQNDLAHLALYKPEEIAKTIIRIERHAEVRKYAWNPSHIAKGIDSAKSKEVTTAKSKERFQQILSFFPPHL